MKIPGCGPITPLEDEPNRFCRKWQLRPKSFTNPKTGFLSTAMFNVTLTEGTEALKRMVNGTGKARAKKKTNIAGTLEAGGSKNANWRQKSRRTRLRSVRRI